MKSNKTKVVSVRLRSLTEISPLCYKAIDWQGNTTLIPKSQVFGKDYSVSKSAAYWISEWILKQKTLQYSTKKEAWFDKETGKMLPTYKIEIHTPERISPIKSNTIERLKK